jgi:hypothetical protein
MLDHETTRTLLNRLIDVAVAREVASRKAEALARDIEIMEVRLSALDKENERLADELLSLEDSLCHLQAVYPFVVNHWGTNYIINPKGREIEVYPIPAQDITTALTELYQGA